MIYLDNSATTFPKPEEVYQALDYANRHLAFNAGRGGYEEASVATKIIQETRSEVASFVKAQSSDVAFLSSATECLNLIINGLSLDDGDIVYISPFEHNAIVRPLYEIKKTKNIEILFIPFNQRTWLPDISKLEDMMAFKKPKAVFVSQVSNVIGLMVNYQAIFSISKKYDAINILDSAQAFGVLDPSLENVDFCFYIAKAFVRDEIDIEILEDLLSLGGLGIQYCLKSEQAFSRLDEIAEDIEFVDYKEFNPKYNERDVMAREKMRQLINSEANKVTNVFSTLL